MGEGRELDSTNAAKAFQNSCRGCRCHLFAEKARVDLRVMFRQAFDVHYACNPLQVPNHLRTLPSVCTAAAIREEVKRNPRAVPYLFASLLWEFLPNRVPAIIIFSQQFVHEVSLGIFGVAAVR
jgi:hypothetical protein